MRAIWTIALKDLRELTRDKVGLFWCLGFPLALAVFFANVFAGGGGKRAKLGVAVVDEDRSAYSALFVERLKKRNALWVETVPDLENASAKVRRGKLTAYIRLLPGFGNPFAALGGGKTTLEIGLDPSRTAEGGFLQGMVVQTQFEAMKERFSDRSWLRGMISENRDAVTTAPGLKPLQRVVVGRFLGELDTFVRDADTTGLMGAPGTGGGAGGNSPAGPGSTFGMAAVSVMRDYRGEPRSAYDVTFPSGIVWGLVGCASAFATSIVGERRKGTYQRLRSAPISAAQVLLGKGLACLLACLGVMSALLAIAAGFFHIHVGSFPLLAAGMLSAAALFTGVMMLVSVTGRTEAAVSGTGWAIFIVMMMFGGGMIPLMAMPAWMQTASSFSPAKWAVLALEGAIWRDFTLLEMLLPCGVGFGAGLAMFAAGWTIFRRADR